MSCFVLVSGDFKPHGGMDRPNYELAWHLADRVGAEVHLVGHYVSEPLARHPRVQWHKVPLPFQRHALGEPLLACHGRRVARSLAERQPRVVVNGGNCFWPDVNWVHAVHAMWEERCEGAPLSARLRGWLLKRRARARERRALKTASRVMTNSLLSRGHLIERLGLAPERVSTVYYGVDPQVFHPSTQEERLEARRLLGLDEARPLVAFVGALGYDRNKGFDLLFAAWQRLCADTRWDADLAVAGAGAELELWKKKAAQEGMKVRIRFLGFTEKVPSLLAACDALVSPTRYDSYGMGVHEALCRGVPAFVTRSAGVSERYPKELEDLLLSHPMDGADLAERLRQWRREREAFATRVAPFGARLRERTWRHMCEEIVELIAARDRRVP